MAVRSFKTASISTGAKRSKFWDQSAVIVTGAYESITTYTLSSSQSSITFSSIPSTYKHLQIRLTGRASGTGNRCSIWATFNGDTGSNYWWHGFAGSGSGSASAEVASTAEAYMRWGFSAIPMNDAGASIFGGAVIDILDYRNTNKYKTARVIAGQDQNTVNGRVQFISGLWSNTAAITSIDIKLSDSASWLQHTKIALYGIKGA